jgi:filamentous hemagglutinin
MSSQLESIYSDELFLLAETLGEVKTRTEKLEGEFSTHAKPLEAATNALSAALSGIKALQFHVLDNNLGALSARVEEMRKAVDEQVGVIALELKKADETNAAKAGADAEALRSEIVALQSQLGSLVTQFGQQLERVEFAAKEEAKKLQLIPGPAGAAGASLNPRGTFIDGEVYNRLDVVSWLGSSYIATVDGVTEKPSKNSNQWQTLASRGGGGAGGVGDFGSLAGVAQINQGGTGQTTRVAALNALLPDQAGSTQYMLLTDGSGTVSWGAQPVAGLPSQTSNSGRLLTTNGSTASWSNAVTVSGSNATVGGILTATGAIAANGGATINVGGFTQTQTGNEIRFSRNGFNYVFLDGGTAANLRFIGTTSTTGDTGILNLANTQVAVLPTTASLGVSSGALVVGDGTNGGLGVSGAINAGSSISSWTGTFVARAASANPSFYAWTENTVADRGVLGFEAASSTLKYRAGGYSMSTGTEVFSITNAGNLTAIGTGSHVFGTTNTVTLSSGAVTATGIISTTAAAQRVINTNGAFQIYKDATPTGAARFSYNLAAANTISLGVYDGSSWTDTFRVTTTQALVTTTTASTGTSSGALVVSGGVGVAGAIYAGGDIITTKSNGVIKASGSSANAEVAAERLTTTPSSASLVAAVSQPQLAFTSDTAGSYTWGRILANSSEIVRVHSANLTAIANVAGAGIAVAGGIINTGSLTTGAPAGGTAAAWKLGAVATVSPTSPNRTIEVDIGGTIYYIHAKTTNN